MNNEVKKRLKFLNGLKQAAAEVKFIKAGKMQGRSAKQLLQEL